MIVTMPFDANGHSVTRSDTVEMIFIRETWTGPYNGDYYRSCSRCGDVPEVLVSDGRASLASQCPVPESGITTSITLSVPSGKIIVTDDLRPVYDGFSDDFASYNSALGQHQVIQAMAALGCAYGPVGNSCPGLYQTGERSYIIANPPYAEDDESEDCPPVPGAIRLAGIITDLWAYSIADYADWQAKGGDPATLGWADSVVDVVPGLYRFTHHTGEACFDHDAEGTIIYAHIERLRPYGRQLR